jgi:hypothetical protein
MIAARAWATLRLALHLEWARHGSGATPRCLLGIEALVAFAAGVLGAWVFAAAGAEAIATAASDAEAARAAGLVVDLGLVVALGASVVVLRAGLAGSRAGATWPVDDTTRLVADALSIALGTPLAPLLAAVPLAVASGVAGRGRPLDLPLASSLAALWIFGAFVIALARVARERAGRRLGELEGRLVVGLAAVVVPSALVVSRLAEAGAPITASSRALFPGSPGWWSAAAVAGHPWSWLPLALGALGVGLAAERLTAGARRDAWRPGPPRSGLVGILASRTRAHAIARSSLGGGLLVVIAAGLDAWPQRSGPWTEILLAVAGWAAAWGVAGPAANALAAEGRARALDLLAPRGLGALLGRALARAVGPGLVVAGVLSAITAVAVDFGGGARLALVGVAALAATAAAGAWTSSLPALVRSARAPAFGSVSGATVASAQAIAALPGAVLAWPSSGAFVSFMLVVSAGVILAAMRSIETRRAALAEALVS